MFKKKKYTIFFFLIIKSIINLKKKKILILGPSGNYSYNLIIKKINKKYFLIFIKNINFLKNYNNKIIPFENNNGGLVKDTLNLLIKKKIFINNIIIVNVKHNFFVYKKKKKIFLHKQSYKQIKKKIFNFKKIKIKFINSNSNFNNGINICNNSSKKIFLLNIKLINLKDNKINKTKFIINKNKKKKNIICFFTNIFFFFKNIINLYKNTKNYYEIYFKSLRKCLFKMKFLKNRLKILIVGFYNII
ncbi:MAG: prephenate dehydratase domain-containing protein [Candidatus Carsonella ruddii]